MNYRRLYSHPKDVGKGVLYDLLIGYEFIRSNKNVSLYFTSLIRKSLNFK